MIGRVARIGMALAAWAALVCVVGTLALAQDAAAIQADLDADGFAQLGPREYRIERTIQIKAGQTLAGAGYATRLLASSGESAIALRPASGSIYGAWIRDLRVIGGGVRIDELAQHCGIERVWVVDAPVDAFRLEGRGERIALRDCVAWQAGRHGFAVYCWSANNGILLDHCNAQNCWGVGVWLEAVPPAELSATILRDCTIQANCRADVNGDGAVNQVDVDALVARADTVRLPRVLARFGERLPGDVTIRGYVQRTRIESTWIEPVTADGVRRTALAAEPIEFAGREWRVGGLWIGGASYFMQGRRATILDRTTTEIDQLAVTSPVEWAGPLAAYEPTGARCGLPADRVIRAASQPAASSISYAP